jgi:hypothetical protein
MDRFAKLQFIGPAVLFCAVLAGEGAAYALERLPTSETLWAINLVWLEIFQRSHYVLTEISDIPYFQLLFIALPIFALALCGLLLRHRLALAAASNLSLVYAGFLFFAWIAYEPAIQAASLGAISLPLGPDLLLCIALLGFSLLSVVASHIAYLREVGAR